MKTLGHLRKIEWEGLVYGSSQRQCYDCHAYPENGHAPDCHLAAAIKLEEEGGWIRVEDELPEDKETVLATQGRIPGLDSYNQEKGRWESGFNYTHWKPIQLPRKEPT